MDQTRARATRWICGIALCMSACTGSGLGKQDTAALAATCPWRGKWILETTRCGEYSLPAWNQIYTAVSLQLEGDGVGCEAVITWEGPSCTETETWSFVHDTDGSIKIERYGIDACEPEGCTFFSDRPEDLPCAIGDRNERAEGWIEADGDDLLELVDFTRHAWPGCSYGEGPDGANYLPLHTRWVR